MGGDGEIRFTAVGFHLVATNAVEVELDGNWEKSKYGLQLSVSLCKEIVPTDQNSMQVLQALGISSAQDGNYDVLPLFTIQIES